MSLFATMLYPERFIPPAGNAKKYSDWSSLNHTDYRKQQVDEQRETVYQLVCDGYETDVEIGEEINKSVTCIRTRLHELILQDRIKSVSSPKKKTRYYEISIDVETLEVKKHVPYEGIVRGQTNRSKSVRDRYIKMISRGINTSTSIADALGFTHQGVLTTLYRMESDGLIQRAGKTDRKGKGKGSSAVIWEEL